MHLLADKKKKDECYAFIYVNVKFHSAVLSSPLYILAALIWTYISKKHECILIQIQFLERHFKMLICNQRIHTNTHLSKPSDPSLFQYWWEQRWQEHKASTCFVQIRGSFEEARQRSLQHHDKVLQLFCYSDQHVFIHQVVFCLL